MMKRQAVIIHNQDNVATVVEDVKAGTHLHFLAEGLEQSIPLLQDIPLGHKVAVRAIAKGEAVVKYGESIGGALIDIKVGEHVHVHNMESLRGRGDKENTLRR